ncbi:MAG: hypothetical protein LBH44_01435 [Treponema sp.]|jgi:hypothetical protein|nr:hypothetical protein [Treponema sp.]
MSTNKFIAKLFFTAVLFFRLLFSLEAQSEDNTYAQRFHWTGNKFVMQYEVVIEKEVDGEYRSLQREFTTNSFIDVQLPLGKFRYRIIPYDYLGRSHTATRWLHIEFRIPIRPELISFSPGSIALNEDAVEELILTGRNIEPDALIYLRRIGFNTEHIGPIDSTIDNNGSKATLRLEGSRINPGIYNIIVRNPGGLEAIKGTLIITHFVRTETPVIPEPQEVELQPETEQEEGETVDHVDDDTYTKTPILSLENFDFYAGLVWMPLLPLYGGIEQYYGTDMHFGGAAAHFGMIYNKTKTFNPGLELAFSFYALSNSTDNAGYYSAAQTTAITIDFNLLERVMIWGEKAAITFRAGLGIAIQSGSFEESYQGNEYEHFHNEASPEGIAPHMNLSAGFLWLPIKNIFIEAGLQYTHSLMTDNASGYFRPWLGVGWQKLW